MDLVIGYFFPIVGVGFHIVTHTHAVEFVDHIGTGTDGTVVKILCMLHIQDRHHRIGQLAGQIGIGLGGHDGNGIGGIIGSHLRLIFQVFLRLGRTAGTHLFQVIKIGLYTGGSKGAAIGKFDVLFQGNDPLGVFVIDRIALRQPWLHIHIVVKSKQCFTDAIAHTVPGGTDGHSRVDGPVIIHLTAEVQYLLGCLLFGILLLPGAAGEQQCSAQEQRHPCFPMFHTLSSFHNLFPKYGAKKAGLPSD